MARITRSAPRELIDGGFRDGVPTSAVAARMQGFAVALYAHLEQHGYREIARLTGVSPSTLTGLVNGNSWVDGFTLLNLEDGLGPLMPSMASRSGQGADNRALYNEQLAGPDEMPVSGEGPYGAFFVPRERLVHRLERILGPLYPDYPVPATSGGAAVADYWSPAHVTAIQMVVPVTDAGPDAHDWWQAAMPGVIGRAFMLRRADPRRTPFHVAALVEAYPGEQFEDLLTAGRVNLLYPRPAGTGQFRIQASDDSLLLNAS